MLVKAIHAFSVARVVGTTTDYVGCITFDNDSFFFSESELNKLRYDIAQVLSSIEKDREKEKVNGNSN